MKLSVGASGKETVKKDKQDWRCYSLLPVNGNFYHTNAALSKKVYLMTGNSVVGRPDFTGSVCPPGAGYEAHNNETGRYTSEPVISSNRGRGPGGQPRFQGGGCILPTVHCDWRTRFSDDRRPWPGQSRPERCPPFHRIGGK